MKTGILKKTFGIGLAAMLIFLCSACGESSTGSKSDSPDTESKNADAGTQQTEAAGDYVYVPEAFPLEGLEWANAVCGTKKGIYLVSPFFDEETYTAGVQVFYLDAAGTLHKLPIRFENGQENSTSIDALGVLSDESLVYIKREGTITDSDTQAENGRFFLVHATAETGEELSCVEITEQLQFKAGNGQSLLQFLKVDKEDHIYVSEGNRIWVFDKNGETVFPVATDAGGWIQDMGVTREGQVAYSGWDSTAGGKSLFIIDETSGGVTPCKENIPELAGANCMVPGREKGILVNTLSGLAEYDMESESLVRLSDWADSRLSADSVAAYTVLEGGNILVLSWKNPEEIGGPLSWQAVLLKKTPAKEAARPEKETLTLGVFEENTELLRAVTAYNQSQDVYQVQIIHYGEDDDLEAGITRFINELIAGTGPDIFELSRLDMNRLSGKGVLEDLIPYLEGDAELKREDYFASVLDAYTVNGKLYTFPNSFTVGGMVGRRSYLADYGEGYGWTLEEIMNLVRANPGKEIFGYGSKNYVLLNCLRYNYDCFIDWQNGECNLEGEEFLKLLEFADTFPDRYEGEEEGYGITEKMLDGTLMAEEISFASIQDRQIWEALFGRDFVLKGFPAVEGTGLTVRGNNLLAINAGSEHKEAAWEFIRSLLTEEYYEKEKVKGFPTLIAAYERLNAVCMTPEYEEDENGNRTELSKGAYGQGDFHVDFKTSTEEEAAWMTDVINHCDRAVFEDNQLINIIQEEAAAFFKGQKTARETAEIMQSRVRMYVNENR